MVSGDGRRVGVAVLLPLLLLLPPPPPLLLPLLLLLPRLLHAQS